MSPALGSEALNGRVIGLQLEKVNFGYGGGSRILSDVSFSLQGDHQE
jgi:ATP-binding cassette subfamily B salmochelin/enterobactin exporter